MNENEIRVAWGRIKTNMTRAMEMKGPPDEKLSIQMVDDFIAIGTQLCVDIHDVAKRSKFK